MKRALITIVTTFAALLVIPGLALGTITEIGLTTTQLAQATPTWPPPACPGSPCDVIARTTGFQVKVTSANNNLFSVPRNGSIVAWSITLSNPTAAQIAYFNQKEGGTAEAGISVLRGGAHLTYRLLASSPFQQLSTYFGQTVQFPLATTIPVVKGNIIALTVPTWAPAFALGFGADTSWRASRAKAQCASTDSPSTHVTLQSVDTYACLYTMARLTYNVTLISTP